MAIKEGAPVRFTPRGLVDAFDATDVFPGACRSLQNLVFDQSNPEIVIARPGVDNALTSFAGFLTPGFISLQVTIGSRVYGMVATSLTAGKDQPFCYDLSTNAFVAVTGCTAGNAEGRPTSPSSNQSAAWIPPTLAVVGIYVVITHPGYSGAGSNFFGLINLSTMVYTTANLATHALPGVPTSVANLNNRAYFSYLNATYYSDVLDPTTATNAGQSLTMGDNNVITGQSGLPVQTTSGGVVSALLVFKSTQIWQVTGDAAITGTLAENYLSLNIGCASPRTICPTPLGTIFAGPDCVYVVTPLGIVAPLTADIGSPDQAPHLRQPFDNVTTPSRACAAFAGSIYRICLSTIIDGTASTNDYWFDTRKYHWNGPHTFNYDCASSIGKYFILTSSVAGAKLFPSYATPNLGTAYTDNGTGYNVDLVSSTFPKHGEMAMKQVIESTIELASVGNAATYTINAYDEKNNIIATTSVTTPQLGAVWGGFTWGDGTFWATSINRPQTYLLNWPNGLLFNKIALEVTCPAAQNIAIGTFYARFQKTGYTLQVPS